MASSTLLLLVLGALGRYAQQRRPGGRGSDAGTERNRGVGLLLALVGSALSPSAAALAAVQCASFAAFGLALERVAQAAFLGLVLLGAQGQSHMTPGLLALAGTALLAAPVLPSPQTTVPQRAFEAALLRAPCVVLLVHGGVTVSQAIALVAAAVAGTQRECTLGPRPEISLLRTALRVLVRAAADTEVWVLGSVARLSVLGVVILARGVVFAEDELTRLPAEHIGRQWLRMTARRESAKQAGASRERDPGAP